MTGRFDPAVADVRWQKRWEDERCFIADTNSGTYKFVLVLHLLSAIVGFGAVFLNAIYGQQARGRKGR